MGIGWALQLLVVSPANCLHLVTWPFGKTRVEKLPSHPLHWVKTSVGRVHHHQVCWHQGPYTGLLAQRTSSRVTCSQEWSFPASLLHMHLLGKGQLGAMRSSTEA